MVIPDHSKLDLKLAQHSATFQLHDLFVYALPFHYSVFKERALSAFLPRVSQGLFVRGKKKFYSLPVGLSRAFSNLFWKIWLASTRRALYRCSSVFAVPLLEKFFLEIFRRGGWRCSVRDVLRSGQEEIIRKSWEGRKGVLEKYLGKFFLSSCRCKIRHNSWPQQPEDNERGEHRVKNHVSFGELRSCSGGQQRVEEGDCRTAQNEDSRPVVAQPKEENYNDIEEGEHPNNSFNIALGFLRRRRSTAVVHRVCFDDKARGDSLNDYQEG